MGRFGRDGVELLQALVGGNLWVLESESSRAPELRVGASTRLAPLLPPRRPGRGGVDRTPPCVFQCSNNSALAAAHIINVITGTSTASIS